MTYILGLDLETTGLDIATCEVIEVGAVLWDVERKQAVTLMDDLVNIGKPVPPEITKLTGIETEYLEAVGIVPGEVAEHLLRLVNKSQAIVAHGGTAFDRPITERFVNRLPGVSLSTIIPWIDSVIDLPLPPETTSRKLRHLAADHGFLHDEFAHRAVFDVISMLRVVSFYDIPGLIEQAKSPLVTVQAIVSFPDKDLAKAQGYQWDGVSRRWIKQVHRCNLEKEQGHGFQIRFE